LMHDLAALMQMIGLNYSGRLHDFLLPMGISFYTFQTMSYTIDVYHGKCKAEKHPGYFALYVTFFPQLVAGPIERASHLLHQLRQSHCLKSTNLRYGFLRILWGLFKKTVIADNLAELVDYAYADPSNQSSFALALATFFFAVQIYCDFSGYTDIAIGSARLFGIKLMENFRLPYLSKTIHEFWGRWHISLSTWFRDYVYIPIGGNRVIRWRWYFNLIITFVASGLWHGASWNFLIWGLIHGLLLIGTYSIFNKQQMNQLSGWKAWITGSVTFVLVCAAWIFFRAETLPTAWAILSKILTQPDFTLIEQVRTNTLYLGQPLWRFMALGTLALSFLLMEWVFNRYSAYRRIVCGRRMIRWGVYYLLILLIILLGNFGHNEFIYFQF
ncbi:MAG: MBOAT family O-acyltransferase, partial [Verrucomicrobiota bacterium]